MQSALMAVLVAALVLVASPAAAQKGKPQSPPTRWEVVDANGVIVGVTAGFEPSSDQADVLVQDGNALMRVRVGSGGWTGMGYVIWTTTNCTGDAYIPVDPGFGDLTVPNGGVFHPADRTLWVASSTTTMWVSYNSTGSPGNCLVPPWPVDTEQRLAYPASPSSVMSGFQPPFNVRLAR